MIDWTVEVDDVACPVDDMRKMAWMACSSLLRSEGMVRAEGRAMTQGTNR
jgi:hypothetical protein